MVPRTMWKIPGMLRLTRGLFYFFREFVLVDNITEKQIVWISMKFSYDSSIIRQGNILRMLQ